jgi:cellulose synthase/poly-beta-1,6-N-acetylglucosamine synthase-like glycosyltransferase
MISIIIVSKDEPGIDDTLGDVVSSVRAIPEACEIIVVDASEGRLDDIRRRHEPAVRWIDFRQPPGVRISIPHQRNAGVRAAKGEIIVFTDAGCRPEPGWLDRLISPLYHGEHVTAGVAVTASGSPGLYGRRPRSRYLSECPTINLAFHREVFDSVGGFDETFTYGSDVDFSWRLVKNGYQIYSVPDAVVRHDWGTWRRQLRRSYVYGKARVRLYRKHRPGLAHIARNEPVAVAYPIFLLGLPLTICCPLYPALLLIPAWRNRSEGPVKVLADHLVFGAGVLAELVSR